MYQNYNYYPQQSQTQPTQIYQRTTPSGLKGRPVSSLEEARASSIDFDGSIFYFPDLANKRIYTKQINNDGTATLNLYELKELPQVTPMPQDNFITRDEFDSAISQIRAIISPQKPPEKKEGALQF